MRRKASIIVPVVAVAAALAVAVLLTVLGGLLKTDVGENAERDTVRSVGSSQELSKIVVEALRENSLANGTNEGIPQAGEGSESFGATDSLSMAVEEQARGTAELDADAAAPTDGSAEFSTTNVQIDGVDEADIIKTDGQYIYQVNHGSNQGGTGRLVIIDAVPGSDMKIASTIEFPSGFSPQDIYVADGRLVVVGHDMTDFTVLDSTTSSGEDNVLRTISPDSDSSEERIVAEPEMSIMPVPGYGSGSVRVYVYDLSNIEEPSLIRDTAVEGRAVSTRRIGETLYVIASNPMVIPDAHQEEADRKLRDYSDLPEIETPGVIDSAVSEEPFRLPYSDVQYARGEFGANYITVAGISLTDVDEPARVTSVLGAAENVFSTQENMYVSFTQHSSQGTGEATKIYRFALDQGEIEHTGVGEVAGRLLNQFSMDEHEGNLRVVTTEGNWEQAKNHLFVLGDEMEVVGSLKGFGPTESVFSARFIGDRAYVVTFRQTDPFFVIDVSDPTDPSILGELKIPGFSNYLHPYDENHVIGFGKDATENGIQQGMKMALFDVTDVSDPKEVAKEVIGDSGTESPLLYNHKALLFDRERDLLVFPVTVMSNGGQGGGPVEPMIGPEFQGAYVYKLNPEDGFQLQARLTHYAEGERPSEYRYGRGDGSIVNKDVERALYIEDTLYTVSQGMVMANGLVSLDVEGTVEIPSDM